MEHRAVRGPRSKGENIEKLRESEFKQAKIVIRPHIVCAQELNNRGNDKPSPHLGETIYN